MCCFNSIMSCRSFLSESIFAIVFVFDVTVCHRCHLHHRRVGVAKYSRLRQEFQEKEDKMREVRGHFFATTVAAVVRCAVAYLAILAGGRQNEARLRRADD